MRSIARRCFPLHSPVRDLYGISCSYFDCEVSAEISSALSRRNFLPQHDAPRIFRAHFHPRARACFSHPPPAAALRIHTTICRRFRHSEPKILWSICEFFLTSFPQAPILRFQARGRICWSQRLCCPQPVVEPDRVNRKSTRGLPHRTPRLGFLARLSWAFVSFFSA